MDFVIAKGLHENEFPLSLVGFILYSAIVSGVVVAIYAAYLNIRRREWVWLILNVFYSFCYFGLILNGLRAKL